MVAITVTENAYDIDANAISTVPDDNAPATPHTGTALNTREEAVWAALAASPGTSVAMIAAAAGISRVTVGKILNQFEAEGRTTRVPGGHDGRGRTPDLWYPADGTVVSDGDAPEEAPDSPGSDDPADPDVPAVSDVDDEGSADEEEATDAAVPAMDGHLDQADPEGAVPADVAGDTPGLDSGGSDDAPDEATDSPAEVPDSDDTTDSDTTDSDTADTDADVPADDSEDAAEAEDPAWAWARTALLELADLITGAVRALDDEGDAVTALGRLEMAVAKAPQAHRDARAVLTGTSPSGRGTGGRGNTGGGTGAGGARPGHLRDRVLSHLLDHSGKDFTPYEIGRVLESSSGAVANALDRLVGLGQAELTCERPRRYALAVNPAPGD
ncbi:MarR family transcriptional regulator [Microbispora cellulosiformans]|uniref:MarR family transcriptional regulator n=1 Tax=Microbispora cellulosiformans TaxID=2614688 RepID=A0A5J5JZF2_9ACTN|nr:helix-turn-helix domain-containing protein [Microbispora cellulosiformans]KAA9375965.1 MarR family transcriptional regulator [Microbispora cellulosiformans]